MKKRNQQKNNQKIHYSINISGRVQNVGFRYFTIMKAGEYNITGTVKNELDGSVAIEAEGTKEQLEIFIADLKQGPGWAKVYDFEVTELPVVNYSGFNVVY